MKARIVQYLCGCRSILVIYPSGLKKIYWEYDYYCEEHKGEE